MWENIFSHWITGFLGEDFCIEQQPYAGQYEAVAGQVFHNIPVVDIGPYAHDAVVQPASPPWLVRLSPHKNHGCKLDKFEVLGNFEVNKLVAKSPKAPNRYRVAQESNSFYIIPCLGLGSQFQPNFGWCGKEDPPGLASHMHGPWKGPRKVTIPLNSQWGWDILLAQPGTHFSE